MKFPHLFRSRAWRTANRLGLRTERADRITCSWQELQGQRTLTLLVMGQSNAANFGQTPYTPGPHVLNAFDGDLYQACDPLLGAADQGGSVWSRLGEMVLEGLPFDRVVFAPVASGGVSIRGWEWGSERLFLATSAIQALAKKGVPVDGVLWSQGEADHDLDPVEYGQRLTTLIEDIRSEAGEVPFFVSVTTRSREMVSPAIQNAQRQVVDGSQLIFSGPETDDLYGDYRHDGVHFSDKGLAKVASLWLECLRPVFS